MCATLPSSAQVISSATAAAFVSFLAIACFVRRVLIPYLRRRRRARHGGGGAKPPAFGVSSTSRSAEGGSVELMRSGAMRSDAI